MTTIMQNMDQYLTEHRRSVAFTLLTVGFIGAAFATKGLSLREFLASFPF